MYPSPGRPVPSKAALRILRQLAYISSGTACGAAALVAEERRRRTCLAKTIADNSRKIRQHPRYAHAAGVATFQEQDSTLFEPFGRFFDRKSEASKSSDNLEGENIEAAQHRKTRRRKRHVGTEPDTLRNEVLPSEVDEGYEKWTARESQLEAYRKRSHDSSDVRTENTKHTARDATSLLKIPPLPAVTRTTRDVLPLTKRSIVRYTGSDDLADACTALWIRKPLSEPQSRIRKTLIGPQSQSSISVPKTPDTQLKEFSTSREEDVIINAVDAFLTSPEHEADSVALGSHLLDEAATYGLLPQIEKLSLWLLSTNHFTKVHLLSILDKMKLVSGDPKSLKSLYTSVLLHTGIQGLDDGALGWLKLKCVAHTCCVPHYRNLHLLEPHLFASLCRVDGFQTSFERVRSCCDSLVKATKPDGAVRLFLYCMNGLKDIPQFNERHDLAACESLARQLLHDCCEGKLAHKSKDLLFWLKTQNLEIKGLVVTLLRAFLAEEQTSFAVALYWTWCDTRIPSDLYIPLVSAIAKHCTLKAAANLMQTLPHPASQAALNACQSVWPSIIERRWKRANNFEPLRQSFADMCDIAGDGKVGIKPYNAMIKVCVLAGQGEEAQRLLDQLRSREGRQPDIETFGHMLHASAKRGDWELTEKCLTLLADERHRSSIPAADCAHVLNPVLSEYASQHTSQETLKFATDAVEHKQIFPTVATFSIVMKRLVHGKEVVRLPQWIDVVRASGLEIRIDSNLVVDAIKRYYYDYRPTYDRLHDLVCKLMDDAKHLVSRELICLLRDAVMHDLRKASGHKLLRRTERRSLDVQQFVRQNLEDRQLYEHDSDPTQEVMPPSSDISPPRDDQHLDQAVFQRTEVDLVSHKRLSAAHWEEKVKVTSDMLVALTTGRPSDAVDLYKSILSADGLPNSSVSLDIAIEASLRSKRGDSEEARDLIKEAEEAGMNVTSTLKPLLVNHLHSLGRVEKQNYGKLTASVVDFYKEMDANNIRISHHVAVTAATVLMQKSPSSGLRLLREVFFSPWAAKRPLDIVAMTAFLHAYIRLRNFKGVHWVVREIVNKDIRIDLKFMSEFSRAGKLVRLRLERAGRQDHLRRFLLELGECKAICQIHRRRQLRETLRYGIELVDTLIACSRNATVKQPAQQLSQINSDHESFLRKRLRALQPHSRRLRASMKQHAYMMRYLEPGSPLAFRKSTPRWIRAEKGHVGKGGVGGRLLSGKRRRLRERAQLTREKDGKLDKVKEPREIGEVFDEAYWSQEDQDRDQDCVNEQGQDQEIGAPAVLEGEKKSDNVELFRPFS